MYNMNSNTMQRRQQVLMSHMTKDYMERPGTQESIHQTSIASDFSDNRLAELKPELDDLGDEEFVEVSIDEKWVDV